MEKTRDAWIGEIQYLRGFGALAVIIIHTTCNSVKIGETNALVISTLLLGNLAHFAVPLFCFVTGFVLPLKYSGRFAVADFYRKRALAVIPPLVLFTAFYHALGNIASGSAPFLDMRRLAADIVFARGSFHLWFFSILLQFYVVYPLFIRIYRRFEGAGKSGLFLVLTFLLQVAIDLVPLALSSRNPVLAAILGDKRLFPHFLFFFSLGIYSIRNFEALRSRVKNASGRVLLLWYVALSAAALFPLILGIRSGYRVTELPPHYHALGKIFFPLACAVLFTLLYRAASFMTARKGFLAFMLERTGRYSFGIYLVHVFFLSLGSKALRTAHIGITDWAFYPLLFVATVISSYYCVKSIAPLRFSRFVIGASGA